MMHTHSIYMLKVNFRIYGNYHLLVCNKLTLTLSLSLYSYLQFAMCIGSKHASKNAILRREWRKLIAQNMIILQCAQHQQQHQPALSFILSIEWLFEWIKKDRYRKIKLKVTPTRTNVQMDSNIQYPNQTEPNWTKMEANRKRETATASQVPNTATTTKKCQQIHICENLSK